MRMISMSSPTNVVGSLNLNYNYGLIITQIPHDGRKFLLRQESKQYDFETINAWNCMNVDSGHIRYSLQIQVTKQENHESYKQE